ncbi:MAG: hypothetical protein JSR60_01030 [Proteobacteria bacterium]|nr:hypothetical protein [Pseudomonadota bacterium]
MDDVTVARVASCACGKVRIRATGKPLASAVCYCSDCQAGGRQLEDAGAHADFRDAWGGSPYMTYRNDRLEYLAGEDLLTGYKLGDGAPTTRYVSSCCHSAVVLRFGPGWWSSLYRVRFGDDAAPLEFRTQTANIPDASVLPRDVPVYRSFGPKLFVRLIASGLGTLFARLG